MGALIAELRRRNVHRAAAAYIAVSWLILQAGSFFAGMFEMSPALLRGAFVLLVLGFIPALLLTWLYAITPAGLVRNNWDSRGADRAVGVTHWLNIVFIVSAVAIASLLVIGRFVLGPVATTDAGPRRATNSIAVLPFANMSADAAEDYFGDGLAEEILNRLAKIPQLRVIARTSSFSFRDRKTDVATIAKALGVSTVLGGSVRKSGDVLRITAELIRATDSSTLWSETYERPLSDVFVVQDDIAQAVIQQLRIKLGEGLPPHASTRSIDAYALYLHGNYFSQRRQNGEAIKKAIDLYKQALALDPHFVEALANLSIMYGNAGYTGALPVDTAFGEARKTAREALRLNPRLAISWVALGGVQSDYDWDWQGADRSFRKALALDPQDLFAKRSIASLSHTLGRLDEAIALQSAAVELDPMRSPALDTLIIWLLDAHRADEAERVLERRLKLEPDHYASAMVYQAQGRYREALTQIDAEESSDWRAAGRPIMLDAVGRHQEAAAALQEFAASHPAWPYNIATAYAFRGDLDSAFHWLDEAYRIRDSGLLAIKMDFLLAKIRKDPRYTALLKKMKLPL
jgi:TolB-like protein/Tfp pilus assembly protein PilF